MEKGRERLFHAHRRTATADISRQRQQFFHRNKFHLLISRDFCGLLQVNLGIARNDTYKKLARTSCQHDGLEHLAYVLVKLLGYMGCGKIVLVDRVRHQFILNLGPVEQPRHIGFRRFVMVFHIRCKSTKKTPTFIRPTSFLHTIKTFTVPGGCPGLDTLPCL